MCVLSHRGPASVLQQPAIAETQTMAISEGEMAGLRGYLERCFGEVDRRCGEVIAQNAHLRSD